MLTAPHALRNYRKLLYAPNRPCAMILRLVLMLQLLLCVQLWQLSCAAAPRACTRAIQSTT